MIDYDNIALAVSFYKNRGYHYTEVPWTVSEAADSLTRPINSRALTTPFGNLIASGEQGLLELLLNYKLNAGKYVCVTPCFRDEPVIDVLHKQYFLKVELMAAHTTSPEMLREVTQDALEFYTSLNIPCNVIPTGPDSVDIVDASHQIELDSYGLRKAGGLCWIYGTGCAEPRTSYVKKINAPGAIS